MANKKLIQVKPDGSNFGEALREAGERVRKELPIEIKCPKCGKDNLHQMWSINNWLLNTGGVCPKCSYVINFSMDLMDVLRERMKRDTMVMETAERSAKAKRAK